MDRYSKHCGRAVVSGLWAFCPFCGDTLGKSPSSKVGTESIISQTGPSHISVLETPLTGVDGLKVSELRKEIALLGGNTKSRDTKPKLQLILKALRLAVLAAPAVATILDF